MTTSTLSKPSAVDDGVTFRPSNCRLQYAPKVKYHQLPNGRTTTRNVGIDFGEFGICTDGPTHTNDHEITADDTPSPAHPKVNAPPCLAQSLLRKHTRYMLVQASEQTQQSSSE